MSCTRRTNTMHFSKRYGIDLTVSAPFRFDLLGLCAIAALMGRPLIRLARVGHGTLSSKRIKLHFLYATLGFWDEIAPDKPTVVATASKELYTRLAPAT